MNGHHPSTHQTPPPPNTVDVLAWLGRATLDVIGEAGSFLLMLVSCGLISVSGFGYSFHSLPRSGTDPRSEEKTDKGIEEVAERK